IGSGCLSLIGYRDPARKPVTTSKQKGNSMPRPSFSGAWAAFTAVNVSVSDVGRKIGGHVQMNIDSGVFQNACPIRMSYVLNAMGFPIPRSSEYETVSGADGLFYIFRVNAMMKYLQTAFGAPDKTVRNPKPSDFAG